MKTEIKKILYRFLQDGISSDDAAQQVLDLFSVSKRFNFPNFIAGVMVGITICIIIVELAF
jgi:hypothetical protein